MTCLSSKSQKHLNDCAGYYPYRLREIRNLHDPKDAAHTIWAEVIAKSNVHMSGAISVPPAKPCAATPLTMVRPAAWSQIHCLLQALSRS